MRTKAAQPKTEFVRLSDVSPDIILQHMSDARLRKHMPLIATEWSAETVAEFIAAKEQSWEKDGLGHWAILCDGAYVGWGGFQKENDEWDFGLVLKPENFGLGLRITQKAMAIARADPRIPYVTFLIPQSRTNLGGLERLGAQYVENVDYDGETFMKYRLETTGN